MRKPDAQRYASHRQRADRLKFADEIFAETEFSQIQVEEQHEHADTDVGQQVVYEKELDITTIGRDPAQEGIHHRLVSLHLIRWQDYSLAIQPADVRVSARSRISAWLESRSLAI